jgi:hypothetical protein
VFEKCLNSVDMSDSHLIRCTACHLGPG